MPYRRLPSLMALRAFEAVARNGSMKKAAEELNVTPGAMSQLVKKLEEELDCVLLTRVNRGFEITEAGISLQSGLSDAFIKMHEAVASVKPAEEQRTLMVACGPPFAAKWLVPRLGDFIQKHPDIDIRISSSFRKEDYGKSKVDIGIRLSNDNDPSLERVWIGEETAMVLASPEFIERQKLTEPNDILRVPIISEDNKEYFRDAVTWEHWLEKVGLPTNSANRGINFGEHEEQALDAAIAGTGVVLGRKVLASRDIEQRRLLCPFGPELKTGVHYQVVCRKELQHSQPAILFKDWLVAELTASLNMQAR